MSALSYALATAIGNQPSPTIALRDLVAREQGRTHRFIFRLESGRRFVGYGTDPLAAHNDAYAALPDEVDPAIARSCVKIAR